MDQKKIQRIIGIVVVIALVIVVMPLILGKNDIPMESATNVKAPLPDHSTAITAASDTTSSEAPSPTVSVEPISNAQTTPAVEPTMTSTDVTQTTAASETPALPTPPALSSAEATPVEAQKPAETSSSKPTPAPGSIIYEPTTTAAPIATEELDKSTPTITENPATPVATNLSAVKIKQAVMKEKKSPLKSSIIVAQTKTAPSLHKIKTGWVVQVGNFAQKKNATHLAKALRAAGYKAFTQDVKTAKGKINTRVYIGPESQLASATKLSTNVHRHMNIKGYVVSYKL